MQSTPENARCIACNYPLRGLPNPRCPECGLPFNPADAATMNLGRVPGPIARHLLRRTGWPTLFLSVAIAILFVITSGPPHLIAPRLADMKYLMDSRVWKDNLHTRFDTAYITAVILLLSISAFIFLRSISRLIAQRVYARREKLPRHHALRSFLLLLCMTLSIAIILTAWPIRVIRLWTARMNSQLPSVMFSLAPGPNGCPVELPETDQLIALRIASTSRWQPRRNRTAALSLFISVYPKEALAALVQSITNDPNPEFRALAIHIISLTHNPQSAARFEQLLSDPAPAVRAAAADAIDILRGPGLTQPDPTWTVSPPEIDVDPPINVSNLLPINNRYHPSPLSPVDFTDQTRSHLEAIMTTGQSSDERQAAARALVNWPPASYQLRVAEWGVWIADPAGNLPLVQSVIDEIPPFVHRLGNPYDSLAERYPQWMGDVDKPIIHITVDRPMALDIKVAIQFGRPWFAYPKPDDLALLHGRFPEPPASTRPINHLIQSEMKKLDPSALPNLPDLREGYPWLSPHHHYVFNDPRFGSYPGPLATSLGLRWQSLIVLPKEAAWMHPPAVPADPKFKWWADLRQVPSSYISSRDESDRFLYYDGPTHAKPPLVASLKNNILTFKQSSDFVTQPSRHFRTDDQFPTLEQDATPRQKSREAFFIQVTAGQPTGIRFTIPEAAMPIIKTLPANLPIAPDAVIPSFKKLLTDYGLTPEESQGLINAWQSQFFQTNGRRLLLRLSAADYDALCPLSIKPPPKPLVRLGFVLTEFQ